MHTKGYALAVQGVGKEQSIPLDPELQAAANRHLRQYEKDGAGRLRVGQGRRLAPQGPWGPNPNRELYQDRPLRVFPYPRVSGELQEREGFSLDRQVAALDALVKEKAGVLVKHPKVDEWVDADGVAHRRDLPEFEVGSASTTKDRPIFEWAWRNRDKWDVLLVVALDRFHRSGRLETDLRTLQHEKKFFVSMTEPEFDTTSYGGLATLGIMALMARLEVVKTQERVQPVKVDMVFRRGLFDVGFRAPFGYRWSEINPRGRNNRKYGGGCLVHDETVDPRNGMTEAAIVRFIFEKRAQGAAFHQIVESLGWCGCHQRNAPSAPEVALAKYGPPRTADGHDWKKGKYVAKRGRHKFSRDDGEKTLGRERAGQVELRTFESKKAGTRRCGGVQTVQLIVDNPVYRGWLRWGKDPKTGLPGLHDLRPRRELQRKNGGAYVWDFTPLVSDDLWRAAQRQRGAAKGERKALVLVPLKLQPEVAAWFRGEVARRRTRVSRLARALVDLHAPTAAGLPIRGQAWERVQVYLLPAEVEALKARAKAVGRGSASSVLRGCIAAEMARASASAGVVPVAAPS